VTASGPDAVAGAVGLGVGSAGVTGVLGVRPGTVTVEGTEPMGSPPGVVPDTVAVLVSTALSSRSAATTV
jgi:hypothetical protein